MRHNAKIENFVTVLSFVCLKQYKQHTCFSNSVCISMAVRSRPQLAFQTEKENGIGIKAFNETAKLYANVVEALDAQRLRIFDSVAGSLKTEYILEKEKVISCIAWEQKPLYASEQITTDISGSGEILVLGTNSGEILIYSEHLGSLTRTYSFGILQKIIGAHVLANDGFAIDTTGKVVCFSVNTGEVRTSFTVPSSSREFSGLYLSTVFKNLALASSHNIHIVDLNHRNPIDSLTTHTSMINSVVFQYLKDENEFYFGVSANQDRFINLYSKELDGTGEFPTNTVKNVGALVCENEVKMLSIAYEIENPETGVLAALTNDGTIEMFENPWLSKLRQNGTNVSSLSHRRKLLTSHSTLKICFCRSRGDPPIVLESIAFESTDSLTVVWKESTRTVFETVPWRILSSQATNGLIELVRSKTRLTSKNKTVSNVYDESNATISSGVMQKDLRKTEEIGSAEATEGEEQEPSLAERLQNLTKLDQQAQALSTQISASTSLSTVLTQALKTNDQSLLESCFNNNNVETIDTTIRRLDPSLAPILLDKLAEKLALRPMRADVLMVWIRCTLITHGGHLVLVDDLKHKLANLHSILEDRASKYSSMLALQGKLDLVLSQIAFRKAGGSKDNAEDEEPISIYYEGYEESIDEASSTGDEGYSSDDSVDNEMYSDEENSSKGAFPDEENENRELSEDYSGDESLENSESE